MYFPIAEIDVSPWIPFTAGFLVAFLCSMGTFITSVVAVLFYQFLAPFYPELAVAPDWMLGVLMGFGGMIGMYAGARAQKFIPANLIKWILAILLVFTGSRYFLSFLF